MKRVSLLLLCWLFAESLAAQYTDQGAWIGAQTKYGLIDDLDLRLEVQTRFDYGITRYSALIGDLGLRYKLAKKLDATLTYRIGHRNTDKYLFETRQRFSLDLSYEIDFGKPELDLRVRYQAGKNGVSAGNEGIADLREGFRYRVKLSRKLIKKTKGEVALELFQSQQNGSFYWSDYRVTAGIDRKINKTFNLYVGYLFQRELLAYAPLSEHVVVVGLSVDID